MTVRFEFNGKKYCAFFAHLTTCHIVEEVPGVMLTPFSSPLVGTSSSKCHDLDHFDKEKGERKALARALGEMGARYGLKRSDRFAVFSAYSRALVRRIWREQE